MKKFIYALPLLLILPLLGSCEKAELMDYEGEDGLYFDAQYGAAWGDTTVWAHQIYTLVGFGNVDDRELIGSVKVAVAGSVKDYDRPFVLKLVQDSTTVEAGEYELLQDKYYIPAGLNHTYVRVKFNKTERMSQETLQLQLALEPNEHFTLPFKELGKIPGRWTDVQKEYSSNSNPGIHNFFVNDILTKPDGWHNVQFATYSPKKHQLLLDVAYEKFGFVKAHFNEKDKMQSGRAAAIAREAAIYLKKQYELGREHWVIDEDGTMMYVAGVHWASGTRPEDMVDN